MAQSDRLLRDVRMYLGITWDDIAGDINLSGIIARGKAYLNGIAGATLDYTADDAPRALLMDYCRYVRSNALDDFAKNYMHELLALQNRTEAERYAAEQANQSGV